MAYFIQQMDGRFTIRKYGQTYGYHKIPAWSITQKPEKDFSKAQANYFSSCTINYNYKTKEMFDSYFFEDMENEAEDRYRKIIFKIFDTDLKYEDEAVELARLLGERYTIMRQTLKLALGIDTSRFELLDIISIQLSINERHFSKSRDFIITEINPAHDILTLEEIDVIDITGEYPDTNDNAYTDDYDNMYADTTDDKYIYIIDGGEIL
jgi:hypothetical protein